MLALRHGQLGTRFVEQDGRHGVLARLVESAQGQRQFRGLRRQCGEPERVRLRPRANIIKAGTLFLAGAMEHECLADQIVGSLSYRVEIGQGL